MSKQIGISPKVIADLIVSVLGFVLAHYAVELDPEVAAAIGKVAGSIAAFFTSPGTVVTSNPSVEP